MKTKHNFLIFLGMMVITLNSYAQQWTTSGTNIYNNNTGNVGISNGTAFTPSERLHVKTGNILVDHLSGTAGVSGSLYFIGKTDASANGFRLSYNNPTSGSKSAYIDSRTNDAVGGIIFRVDNNNGSTERMRINAAGNVGIGTGTPQAKLHITGNVIFATTAGVPAQQAAYIRASTNFSLATTPDYTWWNNDQTGIFHPALNTIGFSINGSEAMRIASDLKVGIGTNSPKEKLHINSGAIKLTGDIAGYGGPMILFGNNAAETNAGEWSMEYVTATSGQGQTGLNFSKPFGSNNFGNNYLFLSDNGNIGIRTNNATAALTVNGKVLIGAPSVNINTATQYKLYVETGILTEKVRVAVVNSANWADYVFEESYKMKTLPELEAFVKKNKHLPNIPSANEVVKEGIDMATMDAKLLEKIEELTLYIIEQDKRIRELEQKAKN